MEVGFQCKRNEGKNMSSNGNAKKSKQGKVKKYSSVSESKTIQHRRGSDGRITSGKPTGNSTKGNK